MTSWVQHVTFVKYSNPFSRFLIEYRRKNRLTTKAFAEILSQKMTGNLFLISQSTLNSWLTGRGFPHEKYLEGLAKAFEVEHTAFASLIPTPISLFLDKGDIAHLASVQEQEKTIFSINDVLLITKDRRLAKYWGTEYGTHFAYRSKA